MARHPSADPNEKAKIAAAIEKAKIYLLAGDPVADAIRDAAKEAGLPPALLALRLKEACGGSPDEWVTKYRAAAPDVAAASQANNEADAAADKLHKEAVAQDRAIAKRERDRQEQQAVIDLRTLIRRVRAGEVTREEAGLVDKPFYDRFFPQHRTNLKEA